MSIPRFTRSATAEQRADRERDYRKHEPRPSDPRRSLLAPGQCAYCDAYRAEFMVPPHDASPRCESGKRNHCTCDLCF